MNMSRIKLELTETDLDRARRGDSSRCAVAQVIARSVEGACRILVDIQVCRFSKGDKRYEYLTPGNVQDHIVAFDAGSTLYPFRFTLTNPRIHDRVVRSTPLKDAKGVKKQKVIKAADGSLKVQKTIYLDESGKPPAPRVYKHVKERTYGRRLLSINKHREAKGEI